MYNRRSSLLYKFKVLNSVNIFLFCFFYAAFHDLLLSQLRGAACAAASSIGVGDHPVATATASTSAKAPTDRRGFLDGGWQNSGGGDHQAGPAFQPDERTEYTRPFAGSAVAWAEDE